MDRWTDGQTERGKSDFIGCCLSNVDRPKTKKSKELDG